MVFDAHEWAIGQYEHIPWWRLLGRPQADALLRAHLPHVAGMTTVAPGIAEIYERRYGVAPGSSRTPRRAPTCCPRRRASRSGCSTMAPPILSGGSS